MLDPKRVRLERPQLFWNLVYRFTLDDLDFTFMLPYKDELPEFTLSDEEQLFDDDDRVKSAKGGAHANFTFETPTPEKPKAKARGKFEVDDSD